MQVLVRQTKYSGGRPISISPDKADKDVRCRSSATSAKSEVRRARSKFNITRKKKKS